MLSPRARTSSIVPGFDRLSTAERRRALAARRCATSFPGKRDTDRLDVRSSPNTADHGETMARSIGGTPPSSFAGVPQQPLMGLAILVDSQHVSGVVLEHLVRLRDGAEWFVRLRRVVAG
jgi:hypothetical protein